ncbi:hypothetical protein C1646_775396 [Rhizophagus diaphanus]|nr:hypothetical protein C1646_775396 [Rhizophagus diaphanus] [Rhizophagus sp. MUCL 43196]
MTILQSWEKFFNLNRNGKYRKPDVNIDWYFTFFLLNRGLEDKVESTYLTSLFSSNQKKQSLNLLIEEVSTIEKRKYIAYDIFENWKYGIIHDVKKFFEETCNSLLIEAEKDPIVDNEFINKMTF